MADEPHAVELPEPLAHKPSVTGDKEVPHLTEAYQKARRQYAFFSALLIAWQFIGIDIPQGKSLFPNVNVTLRNPESIPWVIFILVWYFSYRTWVEWGQCDQRRRDLKHSRVDITVAHSIGSLALVVYMVSLLSESIRRINVPQPGLTIDFENLDRIFSAPLVRHGFTGLVIFFAVMKFFEMAEAQLAEEFRETMSRWILESRVLPLRVLSRYLDVESKPLASMGYVVGGITACAWWMISLVILSKTVAFPP